MKHGIVHIYKLDDLGWDIKMYFPINLNLVANKSVYKNKFLKQVKIIRGLFKLLQLYTLIFK